MQHQSLKDCFYPEIYEAGCDEAGRGCLAGPVFAAAVILNPDVKIEGLNDSKKLSEKCRENLRHEIEKNALAWAVAYIDNRKIDEINILNASILAMHQAVGKLKIIPQHLIIDGNRFKTYKNIPYTCIVKGDAKFASIAAASILAKTYRDMFMKRIHDEFPVYGWNENKGYPVEKHRRAIQQYGMSPWHRRSFNCCDRQLKICF